MFLGTPLRSQDLTEFLQRNSDPSDPSHAIQKLQAAQQSGSSSTVLVRRPDGSLAEAASKKERAAQPG